MKKRRAFFRKTFIGLAGFGLLPFSAFAKAKKLDGKFVHMVFFWLKPEIDLESFQKATDIFLSSMPMIVQFHIGTPAGTLRDVVDNSYSVSLVMTFKSKEDQDAYQTDPIHLKYVEQNKDNWERVQIYDSLSVV
ncbi:MAG: hypothetical protein ACI83W_000983 [Marinoscillum sp.]|jgi:hypothetical protein